MKYINSANSCNQCGNKLGRWAVRERNKEGDYTGRWLCKNCGRMYCDKNLDIRSAIGKGYIAKQITLKTRKIDYLNTRDNSFHPYAGHFRDCELGLIQSRLSVYNSTHERWSVSTIGEKGKEYDNIIVYCMSSDMKNVERVYIIPKMEMVTRVGIAISKNSHLGWYEKYRVDEKPYNDVYQSLNKEDLTTLR